MKGPDSSQRGESKVPDIRTELPGPKARDIIARDRATVSTSYTRDYPLVIAKGGGAVVEDVDGNVFLDCTAGIAVASTGHSHPEVVKAITEQAQKFLHMSGTDFYYEPQVRLGEELSAITPIAGPKPRRCTALLAVSDSAPIVRPWKPPRKAMRFGRPVV